MIGRLFGVTGGFLIAGLAVEISRVHISHPPAIIEPNLPVQESASPTDTKTASSIAEAHNAAARAASLLNVLAGAASVVASTCPGMCSRYAQLLSSTAWLASAVVAHATLEGDGQDFTHIAMPKFPAIDLAAFPASARSLAADMAKAIGLLGAIATTSSRAATAASSGKVEWAQRQLETLRSYDAQLGPVIERLRGELLAYAATDAPQGVWTNDATEALAAYRTKMSHLYDRFKNEMITLSALLTKQ